MDGWHGAILLIDLTDGSWTTTATTDLVDQRLLGGKALSVPLLKRFGPDALVFAAGPACGSRIWGASRYGVFTRSPLTGLHTESYAGGRVPEALDAAGYDAVVLIGASAQPVVLVISPEEVRFGDAADLWGMDTYAAETAAVERFGAGTYRKRGALVIGPAGERQVAFAVIENDRWRSAGRTGVGAIMGRKRVKALVVQGDRRRPLHDAALIDRIAADVRTTARDDAGVAAYRANGTPMMVAALNSVGAFPTRYWSRGRLDGWERISADALHRQCDVRPHACARCLMACGRLTTVRSGPHAGLQIEGPEYETLYAFGGLCLTDAIEKIIHLNDLCDRLGIDTMSAGNLVAFTMEAHERQVSPFAIAYGDADRAAELLTLIAHREGVGDLLARGIRHVAAAWGLEDIAVHVKGLEPAGYDPRVLKGMGLAYATSDRGACHLRTTFYKPELSGVVPPDAVAGKAELLIDYEDRLTLFDTLILCRFYRDLYPWELLGEIIHGLTGMPGDQRSLQQLAAAVRDQLRGYNVSLGMQPHDDNLPPALHRPLADSGKCISRDELAAMLADYYRLRNWNARGQPGTGAAR